MTEERFEKNEKNRKIAKWLDPNFCGSGETNGNSTWGYTCVKCSMSIHGEPGGLYDERHTVPDFYTSEEANALLLEKLSVINIDEDIHIEHLKHVGWSVLSCHKVIPQGADWDAHLATHTDRKTAIVEAALKLIGESPKEHA